MSIVLKGNNDGSGAIQLGGSDYIQISATGDVTIPQSQTVSGAQTVTSNQTVNGNLTVAGTAKVNNTTLTASGSVVALSLPSVAGTLITESMTLLGTLTTTSGTTQTLSGLDLTGYKNLMVVIDAVSYTATSGVITVNGVQASNTLASTANGDYGHIWINLVSGVFSAVIYDMGVANTSSSGSAYGGKSGITNASTSIVFSGGTFDAGAIRVYGVK